MSSKRAPSRPPVLPGFEHVSLLGTGGFADVFLYEQHMPKRQVAVKVMLAEAMTEESAKDFTSEADAMAQLSSHPAIVTIYEAGVSGDGRPYLVMENCSRPNLQVRYRREQFSVAEALRIGIQVAGAVETAHRAGILHRDIKPANILVTAYNRPALTDFGISANVTGETRESVGLSIPWSPPESFLSKPQSSPASDVYALAATVYTLLAGRSPFEVPGARNSSGDLIQRIQSSPLQALKRDDVPASLERALARGMAKSPTDRYPSALEFARALQKVQIELHMSVTSADVIDDSVHEDLPDDVDDSRTRIRSVVSIDPGIAPSPLAATPAVPAAPAPAPAFTAPAAHVAPSEIDDDVAGTVARVAIPSGQAAVAPPSTPPAAAAPRVGFRGAAIPTAPPVDHTISRPPVEAEPDAPQAPPAAGGRTWLWIGLAVIAIALIAFAASTLGGGTTPAPTESPTDAPPPVILQGVPTPEDLTGVRAEGAVTFTWTNPSPEEGDTYVWGVATVGEETNLSEIAQPTVTVPSTDGQVCIEVLLLRADGRASETPAEACVP